MQQLFLLHNWLSDFPAYSRLEPADYKGSRDKGRLREGQWQQEKVTGRRKALKSESKNSKGTAVWGIY